MTEIQPMQIDDRRDIQDSLTYLLSEDVRVEVSGVMPDLPPEIEGEVEAAWQEERQLRPSLFNGRVFTVDSITASLIVGHWGEYRRVIAQKRRPALYSALRIRFLSVGGVLHCRDGIVLARREPHSLYLPGMWQFPPAGAVDARTASNALDKERVDLSHHILVQLEEEMGITAKSIATIRPLAIVEHPLSHELDLGLALRTDLTGAEITDKHAAMGNGEYEQLRIVDFQQAEETLAELGDAVVPSTRVFLPIWSQYQGR